MMCGRYTFVEARLEWGVTPKGSLSKVTACTLKPCPKPVSLVTTCSLSKC
jgi:hypothetical protein